MLKINKIAILAATLFSGLFGGQNIAPVSAEEAAADNPFISNYLRIGADETAPGWILQNTWANLDSRFSDIIENTLGDATVTSKAPIIFFNLNSASGIVKINRVYFEIRDITTGQSVQFIDYDLTNANFENSIDEVVLKTDSSLGIEDRHVINYRENIGLRINPLITTHDIAYDEVNEGFYEVATSEEQLGPGVITNDPSDIYQIKIPSLGKTSTINKLYQYIGQIDRDAEQMLNSTIFLYGKSKINDGFTSYTSMQSNIWGNAAYTHYIILPMCSTNNIAITYLAVEGENADGTIIQPTIDFATDTGGTYFEISKLDGEWTTSNAVYFPGNSAYNLISATLTSYTIIGDYDPVIIACGDLIGAENLLLTYDRLKYSAPLVLNETKPIGYIFNGDNNAMVIDIPLAVSAATIKIYFEALETNIDVDDPFFINLKDENGNLGIAGELPATEVPENESWWDKLMSNFNSFFGVDNPIDALIKSGQMVLILIVGAFLIFAIIKLIPLLKIKKKK
ncbi:hypothetical protein [Trichlorobacter sp.]|uniref:hypothetical protein n=1 Tax=Trichlorobacter sp. TaxID=2911007 RepID=UPI002A361922|nr:hypothetical protein [Trichlorobacter sp.]MDY0385466.1 hypothetical protein [Trichlorobacter sp.]